MAAKRIAWGKFLNAGQTCVATDYALVHADIKNEFLSELKKQVIKIHGENPKGSDAYVRIINKANFERLTYLIDQEKVYFGGNTNAEDLYISPTILHNVTFDDKVMEDEIFGPILPVIAFNHVEEAIAQVRKLSRPLSLYIFTNKTKIRKKILKEISFGGGCVNDTIMHLSNPKLPFGGVGSSGMGDYHGKAGFNAFSHQKSVLYKGMWFEPFLKYRPYSEFKLKLIRWIVE